MFARPFAAAVCILFFAVSLQIGDNEKLPPLNQKVLDFATAQLGKQVGDGECWTLGVQALAAANAKLPGKGGYGFLVFGRELDPKEKPLPGDILQFTGAKLVSKNGGWAEMVQHTAIVVQADGTKYEVLHQNFNGVRKVAKLKIDMNDMKAGKVQIYRPQPQ
jgi:hypothetical protein